MTDTHDTLPHLHGRQLYMPAGHSYGYFFARHIQNNSDQVNVFIALNHVQMEEIKREVKIFAPTAEVFTFPAWDVQPYDQVSADRVIQAKRMDVATRLQKGEVIHIVTTAAALCTKIPKPNSHAMQHIEVGKRVDRDGLLHSLAEYGYSRVGTVVEPGEFSVRGELVDIFIPTMDAPVRIDFFDDEVEFIKTFDPGSQRTEEDMQNITVTPAVEVVLDDNRIATFRNKYRAHFPKGRNDEVYTDVTEAHTHRTMGHYLPLFFKDDLKPLLDYLPKEASVVANPGVEQSLDIFTQTVVDAYQARQTLVEQEADSHVYRAIPPEELYMTADEFTVYSQKLDWLNLNAFDTGDIEQSSIRPLPLITKSQKTKLEQAAEIAQEHKDGTVVFSALSPASTTKLENMLSDKGVVNVKRADDWQHIEKGAFNLITSPIGFGFEDTDTHLTLITEQDIFGEKTNTAQVTRKKSEAFISHFAELSMGDLIVHADHGIGRYLGLETITTGDTTQDYIALEYQGEDKLFVPVFNLDVLSRYTGGEAKDVRLDKLGGAGWQSRKASAKKHLLEMAGELLKLAAARKLQKGHRYKKAEGLYEEFCAGFPFVPTPEQQRTFDEVEADMYGAQAMDRLVVGDVGFGKTEVALRAAFIAAADGKQVAVIVPTTLLARQHYQVFHERFKDFPFSIGHLSRMVNPKQAEDTRKRLAEGHVDIVIGTHALLSKSVKFKKLGLMIVDEEQKFGVAHKERLKNLKANVDVLTLTATPIPRTLQMSMGGLKSLSTITTPPVDRLAVRTYVVPFDIKVIREAIVREVSRNGQVFIVTPRVQGIEKLAERVRSIAPEAKVKVAHGQMGKEQLDSVMTEFYDGEFNVLVATTIIESGLDIARANTLIVHNSDRFGLGQLYQIRGRVGRSKTRSYAYFLLPETGGLSPDAEKRLRILQRLEGLGMGFTLASYDLDIRGAGNLLGKEQSGHIKEIGMELYSQMLAEAIEEIKSGGEDISSDFEPFSPQLSLGLTFMIPEDYVTDINTRMVLYRRLSHITNAEDLDAFKDELVDRFGPLPAEVNLLLEVVGIKNTCRKLNIEKIEAGGKGAVITFHNNTFKAPERLFNYIMSNKGLVSLKPDQRVVLHQAMKDDMMRLYALKSFLGELMELIDDDGKDKEKQKTG